MGESQDSDPGKPQRAGILQRFSENIELVPIKKRKYLFQSTPCPQSSKEEPKKLDDCQCVSNEQACLGSTLVTQKSENDSSKESESLRGTHNCGMDGKNLKASEDKGTYCEDISGTAMRASAASIDNLGTSTDIAGRISLDKFVDENNAPFSKSHNGAGEEFLSTSADDTGKTLAQSKGSSAPRDDRLHWDLNTPMDEWIRPLDCSTVDYEVRVDNAALDSVGPKEHRSISNDESTPQSYIDGVSPSEAQLDLTHCACRALQLKAEECGASPSSCSQNFLKDNSTPGNIDRQILKVSISDMDSEVRTQVVEKVVSVEHSLRIGQDKNRTSLPDDSQQITTASFLVEAAKEDSASVLQIEKNERPETVVLRTPVSAEAAHDVDDTSCKVSEKVEVTVALDDSKNKLPEIASPWVEPYHFDPAKEENKILLDFSSVVKQRVDDTHFKKTEGFSDVSGSNKVEVKVGDTLCQPTISSSVDTVKCKLVSFHVSDSVKGSSDVENAGCRQVEESKNGNTDTKHGYGTNEPVDLSLDDHETCSELKDVGTSHFSSKAADLGKSSESPDDEQSAKSAILKEAKGESVENLSAAYPCCNEVSCHLNHSVDAHLGNSLDCAGPPHASQGAHRQVATATGLEGELDSHLEDGELRDTGHFWEYSDGRNSTVEHVHYDADNRAGYDISGATDASALVKDPFEGEGAIQSCQLDHLNSKDVHTIMEKSMEENNASCDKGSFLTNGYTVSEPLERKSCASNLFDMDNPEVVDMDVDDGIDFSVACDGPDKSKVNTSDSAGDFVVHDTCMKSSRRELQSQIKGSFPSPSDRTDADSTPRSRSGYLDYAYHGDPMYIGADESVGTAGSLCRDGEGHFSGRSWNHGLKSVVASSEGYDSRFFRADDTPPRLHRQVRFPTSRVGYTRFIRRGSPTEDTHTSYCHRRSRSRSRTRSPDFRPRGGMRRLRTLYRPSNNAEHARRSPGRAYCPGRRVSTMRSPGRFRPDDSVRSVMLPVRFSSRAHEYEGDDYTRKPYFPRSHRRSRSRSISPKFRAEARIQTMRVPYRTSHMRERRSPGRVFHANQRFDTVGSSSGRLRTDDDYSRSIVRPVRFQDTSQSDRRNELDSEDYRRKPRTIFERMHPVRNYDI